MEFPDKLQLDIMWSVSTSSAIETREKPHRIFAKLLYDYITNKDIGVKLKDTSQTGTRTSQSPRKCLIIHSYTQKPDESQRTTNCSHLLCDDGDCKW